MRQSVIALLGRGDEPTDAVEEYCLHLRSALESHDLQLEVHRFPWRSCGWRKALRGLRLQASGWRGMWVVVQYTALAWSARGFPTRFSSILKVLRSAGARVAVIFHDAEPFGGTRLIDRLRRVIQIRTMRWAATFADVCVYTVPPEKLT